MKLLENLFKPKPFVPYQLFGHEGLRELVSNFYWIMENDKAAQDCLRVHELENDQVPPLVKEKLFEFLCGWTGGPQLFIQKHGPPRMRQRHIQIQIGAKEAGQWLYCMEKALEKSSIKLGKKHKQLMLKSFAALAVRIQNQ
ncbi:MAG: hypothetical protein WD025_05355 [Bacteriovoracaceae bacterium]